MTPVRLGTGAVTAACWAWESGDVFVGFRSGQVATYRPRPGVVGQVDAQDGREVEVLACDGDGQALVVQRGAAGNGDGPELASYCRWDDRKFQRQAVAGLMSDGTYDERSLLPTLAGGAGRVLTIPVVCEHKGLWVVPRGTFQLSRTIRDDKVEVQPGVCLALWSRDPGRREPILVGLSWVANGGHPTAFPIPFAVPPGSPFEDVAVSWLRLGPETLVLAGVSGAGVLIHHIVGLGAEGGR